jgi:hypothetical protein
MPVGSSGENGEDTLSIDEFSTWLWVQFRIKLGRDSAQLIVEKAKEVRDSAQLIADTSPNTKVGMRSDENGVSPETAPISDELKEVSAPVQMHERSSPPSTPQHDRDDAEGNPGSPGFLAELLLSSKSKPPMKSTTHAVTPIQNHQIEGLSHVSCSLQNEESLQSEAPTQAPTQPQSGAPELESIEWKQDANVRGKLGRQPSTPSSNLSAAKGILAQVEENGKKKSAGSDTSSIALLAQGLEFVKKVQTENLASGASVPTMSVGDCPLPGEK